MKRAYRALACVAAIGLVAAIAGQAHGRLKQAAPTTALGTAGQGSAGCGHAWEGGVDSRGTLPFGGLQRTYLLHVPPSYSPTTPWALVLNLHGLGANAAEQAGLSHMSRTADIMHALVVYPNGTGQPTGWNVGLPPTGVDDVGFLGALVHSLEQGLCVDTSRVAATGASDGALMDYYLACAGVSWLSVIAPVAGYRPVPQARCALAHPTPLMAFNGQLDKLVPYDGIGRLLPPIPQQVGTWARAQGCAMPGRTGFSRGDVVETIYSPCAGEGEVELYTITDGGHTWPGGFPVPPFGKTTQVIDASSLILSFVQAFPQHAQ